MCADLADAQLAALVFQAAVRTGRVAVVVSPLTPEAVRNLPDPGLPVSVVWWQELHDRLPTALLHACSGRRGATDAELFARLSASPLIYRAFAIAYHQSPPFATVAEWARVSKVRPHELRYHVGALAPRLRLKRFLQWHQLLWAIERHNSTGHEWSRVAAALQCHLRTLERLAVRLVAGSLSDASVNVPRVRRAYQAWLRDALGQPPGGRSFPVG